MQWTGLNELREKYLSFFESKGHLRMKSASLIPQGDKSLLLINSGMAPLKKFFTGEITPPRKRVTTCQKCIRTPDIERVGKTARHGTYFEMLGNFSFGDYFKPDATAWAWEFCTKVLELPVDRLWVSIYEEDDEAFEIWTKQVGVSPDRMVRLGKEDNFWEHGTGPCGPCSEIYFDRGEEYGCGSPTCAVGCDCDRYVEFWNLVFTQFDSDGNGNYALLDHKNIDTGMGLERIACIMQGVNNLFEVDTVQNIMKHISQIAGVKYGESESTDISLRVITDHIRSTTFMVGDGVMPTNEGRGYVLRRLLRRAARHGRLLGITEPFLNEVCDTVIKENASAYPELGDKKDFIKKVILNEEISFGKTIDQGLTLLNTIIENCDGKVISGEDAFKLNDTFGFPLDLTRDIAEEKGLTVDEEGFTRLLNEQKQRSREDAGKKNVSEAWAGTRSVLEGMEKTVFTGYEKMSDEGKVLVIVRDGEIHETLSEGEEAVIVADKTPFYAESGGQTGDTGVIRGDGIEFIVTDTTKTQDGIYMHTGKLVKGEINDGDKLAFEVDKNRRAAIMRNHTAAHLLQAALRKVLGTHVEQAGQLVTDKTVRFDFTHFSALTHEEIAQVESEVNADILNAVKVTMTEMPIDEARRMGAMALFGEKYGDVVRVVNAEGCSIELCGGTHVDNTSKLGLFKIVSEGSVAAGVRRIEGVTGFGVLDKFAELKQLLDLSAQSLKVGNIEELPARCKTVMGEMKAKDKEIEALNSKLAGSQVDSLLDGSKSVGDIKVVAAKLAGATPDVLRTVADKLRDKEADCIAVLACINGEKATIACACSKNAIAKKAHAGNIVRSVARIAGGSGGGKPDYAMAGAKDISKLDEALDAVAGIVSEMIG
ncbi:MAG: alanine--tRNA ligase [Clostridia bacterium]|nr:alanine--tRNA ligase [Clostridia bacterium]